MSQDLFVELAELADLLGTINREALALRIYMQSDASLDLQEIGQSALVRDLLSLSSKSNTLANAISQDSIGIHVEEDGIEDPAESANAS